MFCTYCGKQIIDEARFCNFCGKPVTNTAAPVSNDREQPGTSASSEYSAPYSVPQTQQPIITPTSEPYPVPETETTDGSYSYDTGTAESAPTDSLRIDAAGSAGSSSGVYNNDIQTGAIPVQSAGAVYASDGTLFPTPGNIPQSGSGSSDANTASGAAYNAQNLDKPKRERKYTLAHIIMCLASTAVMAITAGIFAGLYFSVV